MSGPVFLLSVVKMSWGKNSKKKPILLVNFCFLIHFDFSNTRIFSFSIGGKVMNPKMPLCVSCAERVFIFIDSILHLHNSSEVKTLISFLMLIANCVANQQSYSLVNCKQSL